MVEEASDNCTQECLILGHSDACWMPASLTHASPSHTQASALCHSPPLTPAFAPCCSPPVTQTIAICHSPPVTQVMVLCHSPPPTQVSALQHSPPLAHAAALSHSPPPAQAAVLHHSPPLQQATAHHHTPARPLMGLQQGWGQEAGPEGLLYLDHGVPISTRSQFYTLSERIHPNDDSVKIISLKTFTAGQKARPSRDDSPIKEEHPL